MLKIGKKKINTNVLLAPLAGCSDLSFRLICREHGAGFCFYEMFDSNSLVLGNIKRTEDMRRTVKEDLPIAAQLLGSDPTTMLKAAKKLFTLVKKVTFLDVNAACPVKKAIKKKSGAYLVKKPEILYRILDKLASNLSLPITVKLRTGFLESDPEQIAKIAKKCEENGAKAIFAHGRTRLQLYSGEVDYVSIKAIRENVKIPVIASGNIFSPQKAKQMFDATGCDGILVARGAFGSPWIFKQIEAFLKKGTLLPDPPLPERLAVLTRHLQYVEKYKLLPPRTKVGFARKIALWYLRGFENAAAMRNKVSNVKSFAELYKLSEEAHFLTEKPKCPSSLPNK